MARRSEQHDRPRRRRLRGYLLLESLLSSTILIIMLTSIVGGIALAMQNVRDLRAAGLASELGRNVVEDLLLARAPASSTTLYFDADGHARAAAAGATFEVHATLSTHDALAAVQRITVDVHWGLRHLTLVTLRS